MSFFDIHAPSVVLSASALLPLDLDPASRIKQQASYSILVSSVSLTIKH